MRLEQKYFVPFVVISSILGAIIIAVSTFYYQKSKENRFRSLVYRIDSLAYYKLPKEFEADSVQIKDFKNEYVILNFWASWSDYSKQMHRQLNNIKLSEPNRLTIISASVRDGKQQVDDYVNQGHYPFIFVEGTALYDSLKIPGVPSNIIFGPSGKVLDVQVGYGDSLNTSHLPVQ